MKTFFDCIPCLIRQALHSARSTTDDEAVHETIVRTALEGMADMDFRQPPAVMAQGIHRRIREVTGNADPYAEQKQRLNDVALELLPVFARRIEKAANPLEFAVRLAIAGNIMDLAVKTNLGNNEVLASFDDSLAAPLDCHIDEFAGAIEDAKDILYLTDNAGEIVFDRLLLELLPPRRSRWPFEVSPSSTTPRWRTPSMSALRRSPRSLTTALTAPGTILGDCSDAFRRHFERSDMIISKGQGNYETLAGQSAPDLVPSASQMPDYRTRPEMPRWYDAIASLVIPPPHR